MRHVHDDSYSADFLSAVNVSANLSANFSSNVSADVSANYSANVSANRSTGGVHSQQRRATIGRCPEFVSEQTLRPTYFDYGAYFRKMYEHNRKYITLVNAVDAIAREFVVASECLRDTQTDEAYHKWCDVDRRLTNALSAYKYQTGIDFPAHPELTRYLCT
jgi:hypothetical protein